VLPFPKLGPETESGRGPRSRLPTTTYGNALPSPNWDPKWKAGAGLEVGFPLPTVMCCPFPNWDPKRKAGAGLNRYASAEKRVKLQCFSPVCWKVRKSPLMRGAWS